MGDSAHRCGGIAVLLTTALVGCTSMNTRMPGAAMLPEAALQMPQRYVVVTVPNPMNFSPHAASSPRGYDRGRPYLIGNVARRTSRAIAVSYRLREVTSWPIVVLSVVCIVYQLPTNTDVDPEGLRAALARDSRVQSVQPLFEFALESDFPRTVELPLGPIEPLR
jgi:hypothetical protein